MKWLVALDALLYIGAVVLFFTGLGILSAICIFLALALTFILVGASSSGDSAVDAFTWYMLFDSISDLFD